MQTSSYDIIIVGGGMVGAALACALAQRTSLSIAVIESQAQIPVWSQAHYHHRVSAIALASQRIFQSLNVWDDICRMRVSPFTQIHVWDGVLESEVRFDSQEIAESLLGFIIENNVIQSALTTKIAQYPQITYLASIQLHALQENARGVTLTTNDDRCLQAKLLIAADGANSWTREQLGIALNKHDYEQQAIVAAVRTALPHKRIARQVFLKTGPLAFLPLLDANLSSIVWSLPAQETARLMALTPADFQQALTDAFDHRLGEVTAVEQRYAFPLGKQAAQQYVKAHVALIGDAAHTVHPLAGQGVNMGLLDAACLADVIVDAIKHNRDFSALHTLRRYERWRKADNVLMQQGVDALKQLFASKKKSVQLLRALGLSVTNQLGWLKNIFMRYAVGDRTGLPSQALNKD